VWNISRWLTSTLRNRNKTKNKNNKPGLRHALKKKKISQRERWMMMHLGHLS
jgi:hypothetical protein